MKSAKFSAKNRLLRNDGFKHVLCAEKVANKQLKISFLKNSIVHSRLGIIVSKKNFSKAIDRNRIKRIIREAFRQHLIKTKCIDLVVLVKSKFSDKNQVLINKLNNLFSQIVDKCAN